MSATRQATLEEVADDDGPDRACRALRRQIAASLGFELQCHQRFARTERIQIARAVCDCNEWALLQDSLAELSRRLCEAVDVPYESRTRGDEHRLPTAALERLAERVEACEDGGGESDGE